MGAIITGVVGPTGGTAKPRLQVSLAASSQEAPALRAYYDALFQALGRQRWWPASAAGGPFEVIVGAILTQSTAWTNVERAIGNLRQARSLTPRAIARMPLARLARLVRPSGYFRQKAKRLKAFVAFLQNAYESSLARMFRTPTAELREQLLGVHGIGPETADSILLYAGKHPVFVVDAYTKRILARHGLIGETATYEEIRALFERSEVSGLPRQPRVYNEYHALLVQVGKNWCRLREARCSECPLGNFLPEGTTWSPTPENPKTYRRGRRDTEDAEKTTIHRDILTIDKSDNRSTARRGR